MSLQTGQYNSIYIQTRLSMHMQSVTSEQALAGVLHTWSHAPCYIHHRQGHISSHYTPDKTILRKEISHDMISPTRPWPSQWITLIARHGHPHLTSLLPVCVCSHLLDKARGVGKGIGTMHYVQGYQMWLPCGGPTTQHMQHKVAWSSPNFQLQFVTFRKGKGTIQISYCLIRQHIPLYWHEGRQWSICSNTEFQFEFGLKWRDSTCASSEHTTAWQSLAQAISASDKAFTLTPQPDQTTLTWFHYQVPVQFASVWFGSAWLSPFHTAIATILKLIEIQNELGQCKHCRSLLSASFTTAFTAVPPPQCSWSTIGMQLTKVYEIETFVWLLTISCTRSS